MNHYPFHIGDYVADTRRLSEREDLAYRRMLDAYFLSETPLPAEPEEIAALIGMHGAQDEVRCVLKHYFKLSKKGWRNKRCDAELRHYKDKAAKASAAANTRWRADAPKAKSTQRDARHNTDDSNDNANDTSNTDDNNTENPPNADALLTRTRTRTRTKKEILLTSPCDEVLPPGFAAFWQAYPRKVGRVTALAWWHTHTPDVALVETMLHALQVQQASAQWQESGGLYVPHPITWLRNGRWQDEPAQAASAVLGDPQVDVQTWMQAEVAQAVAYAHEQDRLQALRKAA